jgi:hypothetical protein
VARSARSWLWLAGLLLASAGTPPAEAQTQTAAVTPSAASAEVASAPPGKLFSNEELDEVVARIALYPDPLLALVLPASTNPIQIVQAQRFLEANTGEEPPSSWDPAIVSLMNYPEVVQMMSDDLDWMQALGDAVAAQQADVMDAVQQVRAQTKAAGNLETTPQQKVIVEKEVVKIVPADPEVIYVPQYNPQVIYQPAPVPPISYYPPAPCYWCSAAAFGAGMFMGATAGLVGAAIPFWGFDWFDHDIGWGFHGGHNDFDFDIDRNIDVDNNISNINKNVVNKGNGNKWQPDKNRPGNRPGGGGSANRPNRPNRPDGGWNNPNRPGAGGGGVQRPSQRPSTRPGAGGGGVQRPGQQPSTRPGAGGGGVQRPAGGGKDRPGGVAGRPSTRPSGGGGQQRPGISQGGGSRPSTRPSTRPGDRPSGGSQGLGSYGRGRDSMNYSQRGSSSRQKSSYGSSGGQRSRSGGGSYQRSGGGGGSRQSMNSYRSGSRSSAHSSRGSSSRSGGGRGGGGGGRGGGGGGRGGGRR